MNYTEIIERYLSRRNRINQINKLIEKLARASFYFETKDAYARYEKLILEKQDLVDKIRPFKELFLKMEPLTQEILTYKFQYDKPITNIAKILGISGDKVNSELRKASRMIEKYYQEEEDELRY